MCSTYDDDMNAELKHFLSEKGNRHGECDWCGEALPSSNIELWAKWRGEYLRVHHHCAQMVAAKNASVAR